MNLLQMSFSAAMMIIVISGIRMFAINKLPKKTFLIFWEIVLIRLLVPFSLPSSYSAYSIMNQAPLSHTAIEKIVPIIPFSETVEKDEMVKTAEIDKIVEVDKITETDKITEMAVKDEMDKTKASALSTVLAVEKENSINPLMLV